ncbi:hypothetical protein D5366_05585 [Neokomagataea tanensis]|uniref:Uncharacterized protein n=1 Tax=Neokomagataea tanensis TaxID=661191 RepID=A0A4Y6V7X2_9PROT|nr:hypothetical protein D5366_05585 [Neokomagataea tanensis]
MQDLDNLFFRKTTALHRSGFLLKTDSTLKWIHFRTARHGLCPNGIFDHMRILQVIGGRSEAAASTLVEIFVRV